MSSSRAVIAALVLAPALWPADDRLEVTLERLEGSRWTGLDPRTVLSSGDRVRFRFVSNIGGWLYVYYSGAGGQAEWIVPSAEDKTGQLTVKDEPVTIPPSATAASYVISGPPGFDVAYWILSPRALPAGALLPSSVRRAVPNTLRPRCRDANQAASAKAAACLDDRAGPASAAETAVEEMKRSGLRARELKIDRDPQGTRIEPIGRTVGVIVYEFRIAHR